MTGMHRSLVWIVAVGLALQSHVLPARAGSLPFIPPVEAAIARSFEDPRIEWGAGHRGIDYVTLPGTRVRAAGAGTVRFAGSIGSVRAVTIDHGDGLETTYSDLDVTWVATGGLVEEGSWVGLSGSAHEPRPGGLHFAVKLNGRYVDPELYLGPVDVSRAIHLVPTTNELPDYATEAFLTAFDHYPSRRRRCGPTPGSLPEVPPAPNDNIAVAIAGLGSGTVAGASAAMYEHGPENLGYRDVFRYSYRGAHGRNLHRPYASIDTFVDIRRSARGLARLLRRIARRHPDRSVDLIAHSMGGVVARTYLASTVASYDARQPRVEHLVTFSSPHTGAPLAGAARRLQFTWTGGWINDRLSGWARAGGPVPDPRSDAVAQLAPGSDLIQHLAGEDVAFGTRVLNLGAFNDAVVPADRSVMPAEVGRLVGFSGVNAHEGILTSKPALALAHAWLRDADPSCPGGWDEWGRRYGRYLSFWESKAPWLYGQLEEKVAGRLVRAGAGLWRALRSL